MAFSDPQTVIIPVIGTATLPRTSFDRNAGIYMSADGNVRLSVSHVYGKRNRRTVRLDHRKVAADPLSPAINNSLSMSVYMVVDTPLVGYSVAEAKQIVDGLTAYLTATSGSNVTKILGGEN